VLYERLLAWSAKYHTQASDHWFEERGFFTLYEWQSNLSSQYDWNYTGGGYTASLPPDPPPGVERYDTYWQTRADYIEGLSKEALKRIEADPILSLSPFARKKGLADSLGNSETLINYCREVEAVADRDGGRKVYPLPELQKYMEWAVQTRVLRKSSVSRLSEETGLGYRSVQKGIKTVLDLIGLPSNKKGRYPGIVERNPRNAPTR
jgi:hypothetical protein